MRRHGYAAVKAAVAHLLRRFTGTKPTKVTDGDGPQHSTTPAASGFFYARSGAQVNTITILFAAAAILLPVIGGMLKLLSGHSTRITGVEVRIEGMQRNHDDAQRRSDAQYTLITATLLRIEDKLDRKLDKP